MRSFVGLAALTLAVACAPRVTTEGCVRNGDCEEPLVCMDGTCTSECTLDGDCSLNARCVPVSGEVGRCFIDAIDQCDTAEPCPYDGLVCQDRRCYAPCSAGCPADGACIEGLCRRIEPDDAGAD